MEKDCKGGNISEWVQKSVLVQLCETFAVLYVIFRLRDEKLIILMRNLLGCNASIGPEPSASRAWVPTLSVDRNHTACLLFCFLELIHYLNILLEIRDGDTRTSHSV